MVNKSYEKLIQINKEATLLGLTSALLGWDQEVMMPEGAIEIRSQQNALLSSIIHDMVTNKTYGNLIKNVRQSTLDNNQKAIFRELKYDYERSKKVPKELVEEKSRVSTKSLEAWKKARKESKFGIFLPYLKKIIELEKKTAKYIDSKKDPYEVLFEDYEPKISMVEVNRLFQEVKEELGPLIDKIKKIKQPKYKFLDLRVDESTQYSLAYEISKKMGLDFNNARLDVSTHPFTTTVPDVRITTRYSDGYLFNITATMHETGHALYEQNLSKEWFGTPLGESRSLTVHESQSRIWENDIGGSYEFLEYYYPIIKKSIPQLEKVTLDDFYKARNKVEPGYVRVNADELTYPLHIILRFELERDLISGELKAENLPKEWNKKMKEYLGITPPNDSLGCLQDVHWSMTGFGYFPTYLLGSVLAAQLFNAANKEINLKNQIKKGNFKPLLKWLIENIHQQGKRYETPELIKKATGKKLSSEDYITYLKDKYSKIYNLDK